MTLTPNFWRGPSGAPEPRSDAFADLFLPRPRWGLRGDPVIWWALREDLTGSTIPQQSEDLATLLDARFAYLTTGGTTRRDKLHLPEIRALSPGMSGGVISLAWWHETARPLLIERALAVSATAHSTP